jgi:DNA-binding GntR family transcriptional regulator
MSAISNQTPSRSGALIKEHLASGLKQAIMEGRLAPGQRVIEGKWAKEFGAAQASVREAINLLIAEGFLVKDAGRSARVVNYREQDIVHIYEVRAAIEGLAAQLVSSRGSDLSALERAFERMAKAMAAHDMKALIRSDLDFHIALIDAPGNPLLADVGRKLLFPLFAFIQIRVLGSGQATDAWTDDMQYHRWMLQVIREGNPSLAGQFVQQCIGRFAAAAYQVWENKEGSLEAHNRDQRIRRRKYKFGDV